MCVRTCKSFQLWQWNMKSSCLTNMCRCTKSWNKLEAADFHFLTNPSSRQDLLILPHTHSSPCILVGHKQKIWTVRGPLGKNNTSSFPHRFLMYPQGPRERMLRILHISSILPVYQSKLWNPTYSLSSVSRETSFPIVYFQTRLRVFVSSLLI